MKRSFKTICMALVFAMVLGIFAGLPARRETVYAADVAINTTNFPDSLFREYVSDTYDKNDDNVLSASEAANATWFDFTSTVYDTMYSLKGIEYFPNIVQLKVSGTKITQLDLSHNTKLTNIDVHGNRLGSLNIDNLTELTKLEAYSNPLTSLNISDNLKLQSCFVHNTYLISFDASDHEDLVTLWLDGCSRLTGVDVHDCYDLKWLSLNGTKISSLDISGTPELIDVYRNGTRSDQGYYSYRYDSGAGDQATELDVPYDIVTGNKIYINRPSITFNNDPKNAEITESEDFTLSFTVSKGDYPKVRYYIEVYSEEGN
ncbi:MAG: hypothetical protein IJL97_03230, partial [Lachnospiraceae bacterium]|nr:hypothetical protein [Lachnospiraceae bacterium]